MNILLVSLRPYFDSLERSLLRDAQSLQMKHNLFFYCLKESFLDESLKKNFSQLNYYKGNWAENSKKRFDLKEFIENNNIDIIHCYDIGALPSLASSLKSLTKVSLVLVISKRVKYHYTSPLFKKMIKRVDRIYVTTSLLEFTISNRLGVPRHRVVDLGIGTHYAHPVSTMDRMSFLQKYGIFKDLYSVGIYIPSEFRQASDFREIFPYIRHTMHRFGDDVRFFLYSPLNWRIGPLYKEVLSLLEQEGLDHMVAFSHTTEFCEVLPHINLWISPFHETNLLDYYVLVFAIGVPILWVRDYCSETILTRYPEMGKTFKQGDARELGNALASFLLTGPPRLDDYIYAVRKLIKEDNSERHTRELENACQLLVRRRQRYALGRKKLLRFVK
jgi:hypothetical protein